MVTAGATLGLRWSSVLIDPPARLLIVAGALLPELVAHGQVWRLLSSTLLHASFIHLTVNMLSLYFLGIFAEEVFGRSRFLALYLVSGISASVAYLYFGAAGAPVVGASGAIFGLLGGILGLALNKGTFSWDNPVIRELLILAAINLALGFTIPGVSNTAHLGGLFGGAVFGWLVAPSMGTSSKPGLAPSLTLAVGVEALLISTWMYYHA